MRITGHIKKPKSASIFRLPRGARPKQRPAPKMTEDEKTGAAMLTRVWDSLQRQGRLQDAFLQPIGQKYIPGDVLFESMFLVSKIRGRIRAGYYR